MTTNGKYISQYDHRVELVADVLVEHSKFAKERAVKLAVDVLAALDHIPEKVR